MKKLALAIALLLGGANAVQANPITFDVVSPFGQVLATDLTAIDWAESGSGVNINPGILSIGSQFDFNFQTKLSSYTPQENTTVPGAVGLILPFSSGGYEITAVASLRFEIIDMTPTGNTLQVIPGVGYVSIFFDNALAGGQRADTFSGIGFNDGIKIADLEVVTGDVTYTPFTTNPAAGGIGSANLMLDIDTLYQNMFRPTTPGYELTQLQFESTQNIPAGTSTTASVNGHTVDPQLDVLMKVDGSSRLYFAQNTIPEPSLPLLLIIGGLAGLIGRKVYD